MNTIQPDRSIGISVQHMSKKFCSNLHKSVFYGLTSIIKCSFGFRPDNTYLKKDEFWALNDITFDIKRGQICGIIGPNGSGKTTLLKILAGILPPDDGRAVINGRVVSLFSHGVGFHPHFTVKENVYINGTILGMSKKEIDEKFFDIIEFSGIKQFLNAPVGALSGGMYVRLGFSIASAIAPDVFFIDEVLNVVDKAFRDKSIEKIIKKSERETILFVSHNMELIKNICNSIIVVSKGKVRYKSNDVAEGINYYYSILREKNTH